MHVKICTWHWTKHFSNDDGIGLLEAAVFKYGVGHRCDSPFLRIVIEKACNLVSAGW